MLGVASDKVQKIAMRGTAHAHSNVSAYSYGARWLNGSFGQMKVCGQLPEL